MNKNLNKFKLNLKTGGALLLLALCGQANASGIEEGKLSTYEELEAIVKCREAIHNTELVVLPWNNREVIVKTTNKDYTEVTQSVEYFSNGGFAAGFEPDDVMLTIDKQTGRLVETYWNNDSSGAQKLTRELSDKKAKSALFKLYRELAKDKGKTLPEEYLPQACKALPFLVKIFRS